MTDRLTVLRESVLHLEDVASKIDPADYTSSAYPSDWTIADTFSHIGSGAVIGERSLQVSLGQRESDSAFNNAVWDEWNAKDPTDQVNDSLVSDAAFLSTLESTSEQERKDFRLTMGPFEFDFDGLIGLRLGEHVLHTWDVEVPFDPQATLSNDAASAVLDSIGFVVSRTAKPSGGVKRVTLRTSDPVRDFTLNLDADSVELVEAPHDGAVDLQIPAEALVRLIYGRLDPAHTPSPVEGDVVNELRGVFPGF